MAEIKINIQSLNAAIEKLESLKRECQDYGNLSPETRGGGLTINELESLLEMYDTLDNSFIDLISNTISFMNNIKRSYEGADRDAYSGMTNKK